MLSSRDGGTTTSNAPGMISSTRSTPASKGSPSQCAGPGWSRLICTRALLKDRTRRLESAFPVISCAARTGISYVENGSTTVTSSRPSRREAFGTIRASFPHWFALPTVMITAGPDQVSASVFTT